MKARILTLVASGTSIVVAMLILMSAAGAARPSIADLQAQIAAQGAQIATLQSGTIPNVSGYVAMDLSTPGRPTLRVSGANVQVVNGLGSTGTVNGLGNLIVGYDELSGLFTPVCSQGVIRTQTQCINSGNIWSVDHKSGSHNVVVGTRHRYSRTGGLVVGNSNTITGDWASVSGGQENSAIESFASVSGGQNNEAGAWASVSGGERNKALEVRSSVSGGEQNSAAGRWSSVCGGGGNTANGDDASVSGGLNRATAGPFDWVAGGLFQDQ